MEDIQELEPERDYTLVAQQLEMTLSADPDREALLRVVWTNSKLLTTLKSTDWRMISSKRRDVNGNQ